MIQYKDIRHVHFEISTLCNSVCPDCPRNYRGVDVVDHYPLCEWSLEDFTRVFRPEFVLQLNTFLINGNYGDFITARDGLAIVQYLRDMNPRLQITISTNASGQPKIWPDLAKTGAIVQFRLDGLEDTHYLYRQKTNWHQIITNAKAFIQAGGLAVWAMIAFDHNRHQIPHCRQLAKDLGFRDFWLIDNPPGVRNSFPVFTKDKKLSHVIGHYNQSTDWEVFYGWHREACAHPEGALEYVKEKTVSCPAKKNREIYVSANGDVSPCCWTGFYPHTNHTRYENLQLIKMIKNNNARENGLAASIEWFSEIESSWNLDSVRSGKLMCCNNNCGQD